MVKEKIKPGIKIYGMKRKGASFIRPGKVCLVKGYFVRLQIKGRRELRSGNQLARFKDC